MASYANYYNGGGGGNQQSSFQSVSGYNYDGNGNQPAQPQPDASVLYGPSQIKPRPYQAPAGGNPAMQQQPSGPMPHWGGYKSQEEGQAQQDKLKMRNDGYLNDPGYQAWKKRKLFPRGVKPPYPVVGGQVQMPNEEYFDEFAQYQQQNDRPPITPRPGIGGPAYSRPFRPGRTTY